jgi:hypothetical protein
VRIDMKKENIKKECGLCEGGLKKRGFFDFSFRANLDHHLNDSPYCSCEEGKRREERESKKIA